MDRISELPDFIVHHILSFFNSWGRNSVPQLVRMSVLSKKWFDLTASFPILEFNLENFTKFLRVSRQNFFKYLEYSTSRFCHQNVIAHSFKLRATLREHAELEIVNRCVELVLKNGVIELEIDVTSSNSSYIKYCLPNILLSVSALKSLIIRGCDLPSSLSVDAIRFKYLIQLKLDNVSIDDEVIKYFTTSCPLLQEFHIKNCHGFKRFCVYGHQNLQKVLIYFDNPVEIIDIEAPNLSTLFVVDRNVKGRTRLNLTLCKKLTTVSYYGHPLPNSNGFTNFLSNFPFIENLFLATTYKCKNLKLSSDSLRTLVLHVDCDLEEIEFSTPNLVVFNYSCSVLMLSPRLDNCWPLVRDSNHLKGCMQYHVGWEKDALWLQKLRQFLDKKNGFKVLNLYICVIYCQKYTELEKLKANELTPYELEHVELQLDTRVNESLAYHIAFVDAVLWCCRPQSLTLRTSSPYIDFKEQSDLVKFTYNKLLEQEDEGHTSIQVVSSSSSKAHWKLFPWDKGERKVIKFIKEEVIQEQTG